MESDACTRRCRGMAGVVAGLLVALVGATGLAAQSNVLLVIADDLGVDRVACYGEHPDPGRTPVLDQLAADGLLFRNAWSSPNCSPARAAMLTGRFGVRTGVGSIVHHQQAFEFDPSQTTLPKLLAASHHTAAVGKWHLSSTFGSDGMHPLLCGFDTHRGSLSNFSPATGSLAYDDWQKLVDGVPQWSTTYATTDSVDEALGLISGYGSEPWFVWLAFNAPHKPYHHPPAHLHGFDLPAEVEDDPPLFMKALTEAMDTELGRLLAGIDPAVLDDTLVVFVGDNGTHAEGVTAPFEPDKAKGTVYEGGVNVPLIIKGPGVAAGAECAGLVTATDLFATVLEVCGQPSSAEDAVSLVPYFGEPGQASLREWVYTDRFVPNGTPLIEDWRRAARTGPYKLHQYLTKLNVMREELYDLDADPFETVDLLDGPLTVPQQRALDDMREVMESLVGAACPDMWCDVGLGTPGVAGLPRLSGFGPLADGELYGIDLVDAAPGATFWLVLGIQWLAEPLKGGVIVPAPALLLPATTDPFGDFSVAGVWAGTSPMAGAQLFMQAWIADPLAVQGLAASNGLMLTMP